MLKLKYFGHLMRRANSLEKTLILGKTEHKWRRGRQRMRWLDGCRTLCDPTDSLPPGTPIPGILQARTLEWVAISFSNVLSTDINIHKKQIILND